MDCNVLEETDYAGLPGIRERPGAVPYRPGPAMCDLVEQSDLIGTYQTCIHWTVHVPYGGVASKHMLKTRHNIKQLRCMSA
jgi:hypothetical protein